MVTKHGLGVQCALVENIARDRRKVEVVVDTIVQRKWKLQVYRLPHRLTVLSRPASKDYTQRVMKRPSSAAAF